MVGIAAVIVGGIAVAERTPFARQRGCTEKCKASSYLTESLKENGKEAALRDLSKEMEDQQQ